MWCIWTRNEDGGSAYYGEDDNHPGVCALELVIVWVLDKQVGEDHEDERESAVGYGRKDVAGRG